jgi:hypothetical protein
VLDVVSVRHPFLTLDQAAFFLQLPVATVEWMYKAGDLPKALRMDGGIFEPVPGRPLIPYEDFAPLVDGTASARLEDWELGRIELPVPESTTSPVLPLSAVVLQGQRS